MSTGMVCTFAELDALGEALRVDVRVFPFDIGHHGSTREERVAVVARAHRDLTDRGLVRAGGFAPDLVESLRLLAGGRVAVALVGTSGGERPVALAAADDRAGVLAVGGDATVTFHRRHPDDVVPALVDLLPAVRPGPGASVTVVDAPAPARAPDEDFSEFRFTAAPGPAAPSARAAVEDILRRPRVGAGHFTVTAGGAHRGSLTYLDTDVGRYAVIPGVDRDGALSATYTPADRAALARHLSRLATTGPGAAREGSPPWR
ncbi:ESX secretion-associated protein EspG [Actinosynnema sp. NPDC050436]|uniref:ESX secretion-associated protein EspG n=1 Tax=Actinosynnema sp. NPDC050436 TaxID=3155659 RepID=UPI0033DD5993